LGRRDGNDDGHLSRLFPRIGGIQHFLPGAMLPSPVREVTLGHLHRVVTNLLHSPCDPKYTQLRVSNRVIATQVLAVPGAAEVLASIGFIPGGEEDDGLLVWNATRCPSGLLGEALAAISYVMDIEDANAKRRLDIQRLRRSIGLEIRMEKARQAQASGELLQFLVNAYSTDVAGDGLRSSFESLRVLFKLLSNANANPHDVRYTRVCLENPLSPGDRAFV